MAQLIIDKTRLPFTLSLLCFNELNLENKNEFKKDLELLKDNVLYMH